ncbi:MAG: peptidase M56 BlaR1 [Clostridia bacterium]|nr:peptidase M56 BlaR1 [Clostridia bacterium]
MLSEIFYFLLNMSVTASIAGLVILLIRRIKRIPRRVMVFLWAVPFIRMCVPFSLSSRFSLLNLIPRYVMRTVNAAPFDGVRMSTSNYVRAADSYFPLTYKEDTLENVFKISSFVWITIAAAMIIAMAILYVITMREIADSRRLVGNVYLSEKVESPALYGIVRPRIILPVSWAERDLKHVLKHERTHIKRCDNLWRVFAFTVAAVHWFNPLSWVFLKAFLADLELACDESALRGYDEDGRREYAAALLDTVTKRSAFASAFGGAKVRVRIENVLSYKRIGVVSAICFSLLAAAIIYTLITNAA